MGLQIRSGETITNFENLILDESNSAILSSAPDSGLDPIELKFKINFAKVLTHFKNPNEIHEDVLLFKNPYLQTNRIYEIRTKYSNSNSGLFGYIIPMQILVDELDVTFNDFQSTAMYRAAIALVRANNIPSLIVSYQSGGYSINDFYPSDIFIGLFPYVFLKKINDIKLIEDYILSLGLYGFTYLSKKSHLFYKPSQSLLQNKFIDEKLNTKDEGSDVASINLRRLRIEIGTKEFIYNIFKNYNKEESNFLTRFLLFYQVVEILSDLVLKMDIKEIIDNIDQDPDKLTGYRLKEKILEVSSDATKFRHLINKHVKDLEDFDILLLKIDDFLSNYCLVKAYTNDDIVLDRLIYKLRNNLVHNLQFVYSNLENTEEIIEHLKSLNSDFEFLIIQLLMNFKFPAAVGVRDALPVASPPTANEIKLL